MSSSNINFKKLNEQADALYTLIKDTNRVLNLSNPVSNIRVDYEKQISRLAPKLAVQAQKMINKGKPEEIIIGGVILAVGWAGAAGIDGIRNGVAKSQAKKALLGYYQELASKQSMIIGEQQKINRDLQAAMSNMQENEQENRKKIQSLQKRQTELANLLYRFDMLKTQVER